MGTPTPAQCICGILVKDLPKDHVCKVAKPKTEATEDRRGLALHDLRYLLSFPKLGAWGMETLIDTLNQIVPEFAKEPVTFAPSSTIGE